MPNPLFEESNGGCLLHPLLQGGGLLLFSVMLNGELAGRTRHGPILLCTASCFLWLLTALSFGCLFSLCVQLAASRTSSPEEQESAAVNVGEQKQMGAEDALLIHQQRSKRPLCAVLCSEASRCPLLGSCELVTRLFWALFKFQMLWEDGGKGTAVNENLWPVEG